MLGSLGLAELLAGEPGSPEEQWALQREDLAAVGRLILVLACAGAPVATLDACAAVCSAELTRLLGALLDAPGGGTFQSWRQVGRVRARVTLARCSCCGSVRASAGAWKGGATENVSAMNICCTCGVQVLLSGLMRGSRARRWGCRDDMCLHQVE